MLKVTKQLVNKEDIKIGRAYWMLNDNEDYVFYFVEEITNTGVIVNGISPNIEFEFDKIFEEIVE